MMTETNERTLDERIALLLGWKPPGSEEAIRLARESGVLRKFAETNWMPPKDESWSFCIDWSIDIRKAWELVVRMLKEGCCVELDCFENETRIRISKHPRVLSQQSDSEEMSEHAICRAFVAWEEGKNA